MLSKRFTRRETVLMGILALLVLMAGYIMLIHRPVTESLTTIAIQQESADTENMILELKSQMLVDMKTELESIRTDPTAVEIPDYDNLRKVMVFLNTTLSSTVDYDLNFQQVTMPEEGKIVRRVIDMTFQCDSYGAAKAVVDALHASPYRCQLGDLAMVPMTREGNPESAADSLSSGGVSVTLTATFFERLA